MYTRGKLLYNTDSYNPMGKLRQSSYNAVNHSFITRWRQFQVQQHTRIPWLNTSIRICTFLCRGFAILPRFSCFLEAFGRIVFFSFFFMLKHVSLYLVQVISLVQRSFLYLETYPPYYTETYCMCARVHRHF